MTIDITDKIGIFREVDYIPKSLHQNNPRLTAIDLAEYVDRYCFEVVLVLNCPNCDFTADYSRTWESQPENWEVLRTHFVTKYNVIIDLRTRDGIIAPLYNIAWNIDEPEKERNFKVRIGHVPLDDCILNFVDENKIFFRQETQNPPRMPAEVLRYIIGDAFYG